MMSPAHPAVKWLRRLDFFLRHAGLVVIAAGIAVMLWNDVRGWTGPLDALLALVAPATPRALCVLADPGVVIGWCLVAIAGALTVFQKYYLLPGGRRIPVERAADAVTIAVPALAVIITLVLGPASAALAPAVSAGFCLVLLAYGVHVRRSDDRLRGAADFTMSIILACLVFLIVNVFAYRHRLILDASSARYYTLSDTTRNLLDSLPGKVKVYVILWATDTRKGLVVDYTRKLFDQITNYTDKVSVEYVPPRSSKADQILGRYNLVNAYAEAVIFECGDRSKAIPVEPSGVPLAVLAEADLPGPMEDQRPPEVKAYKGENVFYLALNEVTAARQKEILFLEGHGERGLTEHTLQGLTFLEGDLTKLNHLVHSYTLRQGEVPVADTLVIAGPTARFMDWEVDLIRRYLAERNGGLIYLAEPILGEKGVAEAGLAPLLAGYGLAIHDDFILLYVNQYQSFMGEFSTSVYAAHPITRAFKNEQVNLTSSRSVAAGTCPVPTMSAMDLVTIAAGKNYRIWGETRYGLRQKDYTLDDQDTKPPLNLAAVAGGREVRGVSFATPRIAVIGDVDMAANSMYRSGNNQHFLLNCFNWALKNENVEIIPPKDYEFIRVDVSDELMAGMWHLVVLGLPGFILLFGILVLIRRRA